MKKTIYLLYLLPVLMLFLNSCGSSKENPDAVYNGTWILDIEESKFTGFHVVDSNYHLSFNITDNGYTFNTNILNTEKVKGSWSTHNDTVALVYPEPNITIVADSLVVANDATGKANITIHNNGKSIGTLDDNGPHLVEANEYFVVSKISESRLVLNIAHRGQFVFSREKEHTSSFSIMSVLRGLLGMAFLITVAWLFSMDRKAIDWKLVAKGLSMQIIIALLVLKAPYVGEGFDAVSKGFVTLIGYTNSGVDFLFGQFSNGMVHNGLNTFVFRVLPTIIFFSALMSLLYYWQILQKIVYVFAWVMKKFMRLSGAESLAAAGNVFLGQTEAPLLVKPYLLGMTKSELMCLMTGGMATIAGGVLAAYIGYLGGDDPVAQAFFAKHLLTASIISAPAAIIAAKILIPETEEIKENLTISKDKIGVNALEAISNGTTDGLKLAINVGAMLLVFISLMALANGILGGIGSMTGLNDVIAEFTNNNYQELSFQFLLGYAGAPIMWLVGVDSVDMVYVGELLGQKTILNEFLGYQRLAEMKDQGLLNEKSIIMATYMLCGFANIASIGIQIGGIGALIPSRKGDLSKLGVRALLGGTIACLLTAVVVGMTL